MRTRYDMFFFFSSRRRHTRYWRDWSSDVCSSDLALLRDRPEVVGGNYRLVFDGEDGFSRWLAGFYAAIRALGFWYEIGRASCRERVEISVVAVSLKKKKL